MRSSRHLVRKAGGFPSKTWTKALLETSARYFEHKYCIKAALKIAYIPSWCAVLSWSWMLGVAAER